MMDILWIGVGGLAGMLFVLSQWRTVRRLPLNNVHKARKRVIGSAAVRLGLTGGLFVSALWQGITLMIVVFIAWWLARWLTLYGLRNDGPLTAVSLDITKR